MSGINEILAVLLMAAKYVQLAPITQIAYADTMPLLDTGSLYARMLAVLGFASWSFTCH